MRLILKYKIWGAIILLSFLYCACSSENPAYNRENIKGIWINTTFDQIDLPPSQYLVYEFGKEQDLIIKGLITDGDITTWQSRTLDYNVYCCDLSMSGLISQLWGTPPKTFLTAEYDFVEHTDTMLTIIPTFYKINEQETESPYETLSMRKLLSGYEDQADSLIGTWSVSSRNNITYEAFKIKFKEDLSYEFYAKNELDEWVLDEDNEGTCEYYRDFIVISSTDNLYIGNKGFQDSKIWDIVYACPNSSASMEIRSDKVTYTFIYTPEEEE